ncbi:Aminobenzoyl-glutamate transporter [Lysobacter dokdonensis DS-58]|uniref:Aminobenzoyl-glutamate transporter n=1 Tax=Lysobacter dokdonensis DS-58 TaxID=1300345 RepID=A0A0A2WPP5_9GAMM|nr:AbgT family transporter [Lysobacter dokdonensis]KGQ20697.1 Aminobenzoyl-glutamate transporter [Lysobacter dokdonensis DS-58]
MAIQSNSAAPRRSLTDRFLHVVEVGGNALPHPATLFALLTLSVIVASAVAVWLDVSAAHPATGESIRAVNLLSREGLHRLLTGLVPNFTGFAPLGAVLVSLIGIGVAEHSGLIGTALRRLVFAAPKWALTPVVVFAGVMSNMASEIGYVLLIPLAGLMFKGAGRHPIMGMAAAFAGVSGGFSANLLLGSIDPLLSGLSQEAARLVDPSYTVSAAANWYFMMVSTVLVVAVATWVTERVVAPRFATPPANADGGDTIAPPDESERRGLRWALYATLALSVLIAALVLPANGLLRNTDTGGVLDSPFLKGIVGIIFAYGVVSGIAYGLGARTLRSDADVIRGMGASMAALGPYIALVFFMAQFVACFQWTNLGLIFAVKLAGIMQAIELPAIPLFIGLVAITAVANLFLGSASAKWALMAPIFVPMFMLLGYAPEMVQAGYRIGDSVTNIISPMMSYFALIIAFFQKYEPKAGLGTLVSTMLPYSIALAIAWSVLFAVWIALGLPVGPGAPLTYPN